MNSSNWFHWLNWIRFLSLVVGEVKQRFHPKQHVFRESGRFEMLHGAFSFHRSSVNDQLVSTWIITRINCSELNKISLQRDWHSIVEHLGPSVGVLVNLIRGSDGEISWDESNYRQASIWKVGNLAWFHAVKLTLDSTNRINRLQWNLIWSVLHSKEIVISYSTALTDSWIELTFKSRGKYIEYRTDWWLWMIRYRALPWFFPSPSLYLLLFFFFLKNLGFVGNTNWCLLRDLFVCNRIAALITIVVLDDGWCFPLWLLPF